MGETADRDVDLRLEGVGIVGGLGDVDVGGVGAVLAWGLHFGYVVAHTPDGRSRHTHRLPSQPTPQENLCREKSELCGRRLESEVADYNRSIRPHLPKKPFLTWILRNGCGGGTHGGTAITTETHSSNKLGRRR